MFRTAARRPGDIEDHPDNDRTTANPRTGGRIGAAALGAVASMSMLFGATTAHAAPSAPAEPTPATAECEHSPDDARTARAIAQATEEGRIAAGHDWAPNKALEFLPAKCGEAFGRPISARGGDPSAPTALLLFHPDTGEYMTTGEIPRFAAEGPAWGEYTSGMTRIERTAPDVITVWWANDAGQTAQTEYRLADGIYQVAFIEGSTQ